jgi:DNA-binding NtrC family response regulator
MCRGGKEMAVRKPTILAALADDILRKRLTGYLLRHGFDVTEAPQETDAFQALKERNADLAILGSSLDETLDGLRVARQIRKRDREIPLILITRQSSEACAIAALKTGFNDYFKWPVSCQELVASVKRHLPKSRQPTLGAKREGLAGLTTEQRFVGEHRHTQEVKAYVLKVAATDCNVLITGETGTGKELVAEMIHRHSSRHQKPLVSINCAALPDGLLESELFGHGRGAFTGADSSYAGKLKAADEGTVLLDEIGDMSPYTQAKILRAVESKEIYPVGGEKGVPLDVRVLAATNQNLEDLVEEGTFRKDLYFRLNVARIDLPPLRDRRGDIPLLLDHYIGKLNEQFGRKVEGFTDETVEVLLRYDWPGNVRELKNVLLGTFIDHPPQRIALWHLPKLFRHRLGEPGFFPQSEQERLLAALFSTNWNKSKAAEKLHWSRMTVYRKMAKYNMRECRPNKIIPS